MKTSHNGIGVMHYFEQCKLKAYPDPGSALFAALKRAGIDPYDLDEVPAQFAGLSGAPWTIAWGDTGPDVQPGLCINQAEADARFNRRLEEEFEAGVDDMVEQQPTQGQFDALVCFAYNCGVPALRGSTLMRLFNLGDLEGAAEQFLVWNRSGGRVMLGLRRRRAAEKALFLGASALHAIAAGQAVS